MACPVGKRHVCCTNIENLGVKIGNEQILKDINLHLHCGELTAIVGRNGAGKSTFMKALLDVIPHSGKITFESERFPNDEVKARIVSHSPRKKVHISKEHVLKEKPTFGYVPQSLAVEAGTPISVQDLVLAATSRRPVWLPPTKAAKVRVQDILAVTNAQELVDRRVSDLSGGELQRVMLALAIHPLPDILLLDEPVSGVDRVGLKAFYDLVSSIRRDYDITILLISHDLDLVARHADRVVFINNATAIVGSVQDVYRREDFMEVFGHIMLPEETL